MRIERTVLLIDDDEDDLKMLEEGLQLIDGNHQIIEAKDGMEGLEKLVELKNKNILFCLIVLDINRPRMDGKQPLFQSRQLKSFQKFLLLYSVLHQVCQIVLFLKDIILHIL